MTEIKNLLFQPLTFHLQGGQGIHLGPRERKEVRDEQISPEIALAARRGLVLLRPHTTLPTPTSRSTSHPGAGSLDPAAAASAIEGSSSTASDDDAAPTGRRKRR